MRTALRIIGRMAAYLIGGLAIAVATLAAMAAALLFLGGTVGMIAALACLVPAARAYCRLDAALYPEADQP
ncbi:hypothetical protein N8I74_06635 [Chitiniphilus purpureus]|uniref:DUF2892 domain-containing protein n=1 Tax=Chitiniphilus purpureus TaxID=2981137 RepID=A0ABY6DQP3_9NEIS|nr:hypothetical protein [Chitiniphilus sp. CD1]UXY16692.1 hypothetical protein N8I74_06635 [Chitiniphilus sp. CD1]